MTQQNVEKEPAAGNGAGKRPRARRTQPAAAAATHESGTLRAAVDASRAELRYAGIGMVRAEEVELTASGAGMVLAGTSATLDRAGARTVVSGGPVTLSRGGAGMVVSAGPTSLDRAGGGTIVSLGDLRIEQGGGAMLLTRSATVGRGGFVGLALTPRLEVEPGGRVLAGLREVAIVGLAVAAATAIAVIVARRQAAVRPSPLGEVRSGALSLIGEIQRRVARAAA
jgi:hypothetical protein